MSGTTPMFEWARRFGVSDRDMQLYVEIFNMIDKNKDGLITPIELLGALKQLGCHTNLEQASRMVQLADENNDGRVDVNEYLAMILRSTVCLQPNIEQESMMAFKLFDHNKDGYISLEELLNTMADLGQELTKEEANETLKMMDINKDGRISYMEFIASWTDLLLNSGKSG